MEDELAKRVISLAAIQHIPAEQISVDSTFLDLGVDSLDGINPIFALENEFNVSIPDEATREIKDTRGLCEGIAALLGATGHTEGA